MTESTWEDTYERSFAQVFRGLVALGARPDEAEDALHDAFVTGVEAGEIESPAGWLFVVASRLWRRRRSRERLFRPFLRQGRSSAADAFGRIELFDAMRGLSSHQRDVLAGRYVVGLSEEETARALGIPRGGAATTINSAAGVLRALIGDTPTNEELDLWIIRQFGDAAGRVTLPPRERWIPRVRTRTGTKVAATLALAALLLVGIVLIAEPSRRAVGELPTTPSPTFSRNDSGTPLPTETEIWGGLWSRANGVAVLRPTWLPKSKDEYEVHPGVGTSRDGSFSYLVSYDDALRSIPGTTVWNVLFAADSLEGPSRTVMFGGVPEMLTIRGHAAELTGNSALPGWVLVWSEGNYRYTIQAFAVTREDLLRIADSLAPVVDGAGKTR